MKNKKTISYKNYGLIMKKLTKKILIDNLKFDVIVGVIRGGLPPVIHLAHNLNIGPIGLIEIKAHKTNNPNSPRKKSRVKIFYFPTLKNKSVLLIEDTIGTGKTIRVAKRLILKRSPKLLKTLALFTEENNDKPDYYYKVIKSNDWVVFPWEKNI